MSINIHLTKNNEIVQSCHWIKPLFVELESEWCGGSKSVAAAKFSVSYQQWMLDVYLHSLLENMLIELFGWKYTY